MNLLIERLKSLKGLASGAGVVYGEVMARRPDFYGTMEPGDMTRTNQVMAAPVAHDLWYLWFHENFLKIYHEDAVEDFNHYDYSDYLTNQMSFLSFLTGLKPLRVLTDLKDQFEVTEGFGSIIPTQYEANGIYWVNKAFFELRQTELSFDYPSEGSPGWINNPNDYVGYIAFPIGQLGVMKIISLMQETDLSGYAFDAYSGDGDYHERAAVTLEDPEKPYVKSPPEMFPEIAEESDCYGRHLIEGHGYYVPETAVTGRNLNNSSGLTAYAPTASLDVELWAADIKDYGEDIQPKKWMRYWIHKDSTLPVPGEFVGILCKPLPAPVHIWWFQESTPFLYAGNWMETHNLTSGVVKSVTLEADRTDGGVGNLYTVAIQGVDVQISSSDFLDYSVGDRVAVLKTGSLAQATSAFSSMAQTHLKAADKDTVKTSYVIIPATYYKKVS